MSTSKITTHLLLNTGHRMPVLGFGTYMLTGDNLREALDFALFLGYSHIDTAHSYGNEEAIGEVIRDRTQAGLLKRKDLFVTTKVPSPFLRGKAVQECAEKSLSRLKLSYVDLLLAHNPWALANKGDGEMYPKKEDGTLDTDHVDPSDIWKGFESVHDKGFARSIGVSNFTIKQVEKILSSCKTLPSNIQLESHVLFQQNRYREFSVEKNISLAAYAPLGSYNRPARHQLSSENLLEIPTVNQLAEKYHKTPAQILLNFLLLKGIAVLPKSSRSDRILENYDVLNWTLSRDDYESLCSLDQGVRFFKFLKYEKHPEHFPNEDY